MPEDVTPRFAGISVALEFRQHRVQGLPLGGCWFVAANEVGLMEFSKAGKELRTVAGCQSWEFFENLDFAHGTNLASHGDSGK